MGRCWLEIMFEKWRRSFVWFCFYRGGRRKKDRGGKKYSEDQWRCVRDEGRLRLVFFGLFLLDRETLLNLPRERRHREIVF